MKQSIAILALLLCLQTVWAAPTSVKNQVVELKITEKGFEPSVLSVKTDSPVTLKVTRTTDNTCATAIKVSSKKIKKELPLNKTVNIELGKLDKGEIRFACGMDMMTGSIIAN